MSYNTASHAKKSKFYPLGNNEAQKNFKQKANVTKFDFVRRSCSYEKRAREDKEMEPTQSRDSQLEGSLSNQERK